MKISHHRYLLTLALLFGAEWIVLAIDPLYRSDWALENILVVVAVLVIAVSYKRLLLSRVSYTLIFFFLCLLIQKFQFYPRRVRSAQQAVKSILDSGVS